MLKSMLDRSLFVGSRLQRDWWLFSVVWCLCLVTYMPEGGIREGRWEVLRDVVVLVGAGLGWCFCFVGILSALGCYRPNKLTGVWLWATYAEVLFASGVSAKSMGWDLAWWYNWLVVAYGVWWIVASTRSIGRRSMTLRVVLEGPVEVTADGRELRLGVSALMAERDLLVFCRDNLIARVVLDGVLTRESGLDTRRLLALKMAGVEILTDVDEREARDLQIEFKDLRPSWFLLDGSVGGAVYSQSKLKRLFDIVTASVILTIMSPVMVFFGIWVKLSDGGPVLYRQSRVGLWGVEFDCIKFRSMRVDAERSGAQWAVAGDPRVTKVGRLMRKTRVDELPQLWSVLKGDMSMVGPRPERRVFVDKLEADVGFYDLRHSVKPGLTGWAQVRFPYGSTVEDAKGKHRHDLFYIKHMSFLFDVYILAETVAVVLRREGT